MPAKSITHNAFFNNGLPKHSFGSARVRRFARSTLKLSTGQFPIRVSPNPHGAGAELGFDGLGFEMGIGGNVVSARPFSLKTRYTALIEFAVCFNYAQA